MAYQKATKKPNHAKKNTRPYTLTGFKPGIERAFLFMGLTIGALHRVVISNILMEETNVALDQLEAHDAACKV